MLRSKSTFAILLASIFHGAQGFLGINNDVIGFANVPVDLARRINEDNNLHVNELAARWQVGPGFYLLDDPNWFTPNVESRVCIVEANLEKMQAIRKVWIPKIFETWGDFNEIRTNQLWGQPEQVILDYIQYELLIEPPESVLRFSWSYGSRQMTIPTDVVNNNDLDFWAECYETLAELKNELKDELRAEDSEQIIDWEAMWRIDSLPASLWDEEPGPQPTSEDALMQDAPVVSDGRDDQDAQNDQDAQDESDVSEVSDASSRFVDPRRSAAQRGTRNELTLEDFLNSRDS
ncbi:hypothetical protein LZ554_003673 [Drepanopeziza brunnea f. sp. 'monogermtubi']|nr:hypothetical protein LZ554_003673 [Drepanopeziza brunnea f. sp. 'monogermtubi']